MTKEETLVLLKEMKQNTINGAAYDDPKRESKFIALDEAIKELEKKPCEDAISRRAAIDTIGNVPDNDDGMVWEAISHAQRDVALLPPVQLMRPKGHWIKSDIPESILSKCSHCGWNLGAFTHKYCANCGADMREVTE